MILREWVLEYVFLIMVAQIALRGREKAVRQYSEDPTRSFLCGRSCIHQQCRARELSPTSLPAALTGLLYTLLAQVDSNYYSSMPCHPLFGTTQGTLEINVEKIFGFKIFKFRSFRKVLRKSY